MVNSMIRFHARPKAGAIVLYIEFGGNAQVTIELGLTEVEDLLRVIDQALGPDSSGREPNVTPDC